MKYDDWGEVVNDPETYDEVAQLLIEDNSVLLGWTDQNMTHLDILLTIKPSGFGTHQGGIRPATDIFVSIMRRGSFGFEIANEDTHSGYYEEKLGGPMGSTADAVAELVNEVKKRLRA